MDAGLVVPATRTAPTLPSNRLVGGSVWRFKRDPLGTLIAASRLGDVTRIWLGPHELFLVSHPDGLRRVLVENFDNYQKQTPGFHKSRIVLGNGLVTSEGEFWRRQRRIATPAFHRQRLTHFARTISQLAIARIDRWHAAARSGDAIDVFSEMHDLSMQIVLKTVLGADEDIDTRALAGDLNYILEHLTEILTNPLYPPLWVPLPAHRRFRQALARIDAFVVQTIARRRAAGQTGEAAPADLLTLLVEARDSETGEGMTDRQLRDEVITFFIAGHETVANALSWAWYLLSLHPYAARELAAEAAGLPDGPLSLDELSRLKFTRCVLDETLRLYPPGWAVSRGLHHDDQIQGVPISRKNYILISPYATHHRADLWDNPEGFDPWRFMDGRSERVPKFGFIPFGAGPRFCIGSNFAMMEAQIILAVLGRQFRLDVVPGRHPEPFAMITLRPWPDLPMTVHAR